MIYLDHNATTPLMPEALAAMVAAMHNAWGNPSSSHRFGHAARELLEAARAQMAVGMGCKPSELIFCASGTQADNLALRGAAHALLARGRHIVTTAIEHPAVLNTCRALQAEGFLLTILPVTAQGLLDPEALRLSLRPDTILISVMHANNETGVVQPLSDVVAMAKERGIVVHTDAVQTAGKFSTPLTQLGADLVSISAHKLHGPRGIAALYVRKDTPLLPIQTGGPQEFGRCAGTPNVPAIAGFAAAFAQALQEANAESIRLAALRDHLESEVLTRIPNVKINGLGAPRLPNTSNMTFVGIDGESIVLGLDLAKVCVSTGSACSTGEPEPSHVLRAMGLSRHEAQGSIRFSLGRGTSHEDIEHTLEALDDIVSRLRRISTIGQHP